MEYTDKEKQILSLMARTDFKNIAKSELITYTSKLSKLGPEVAREALAQFPELAKLLLSSVEKSILNLQARYILI